MIDALKQYFQKPTTQEEESPEKDETRVLVATCALFLEMANIDDEFNDEERKEILAILRKDYNLSEADSQNIMEAASEERETKVDLWGFTNLINKNYSREEKLRIVELLWRIVYADGIMDKHEEYLTRKVSGLLKVDHSEFISAKLKAKRGQ